ncbi:hypothetical protein DL96DRAFT_1685243 [Flagelloscypha sp. PMI_526]|nr:hypothetical protein DL96DRAFT_1685243 [Flagelloscypha sp. PMI_526]
MSSEQHSLEFSAFFAELFGQDLGIVELPTVDFATRSFSNDADSYPADWEASDSEGEEFRNVGRPRAARLRQSVERDDEDLEEEEPVPRTTPIRHGLSGFGRRNSLLLIYVAAVIHANRKLVQQRSLHLHFTIFEMQSEAQAGSGYSCQTFSDGALNTGVPSQVLIPQVDPAQLPSDIGDLTDLAKYITSELLKDVPGQKSTLAKENLAALQLFSEALHDDERKIHTSESFTTRGTVGKVQQPKILKALAYIREHMSDVMNIERYFEQEVIGVDVADPQKPCLIVRKIGSMEERREAFDFVHLANGTPLSPTIPPSDFVSSNPPNHSAVQDFLSQNSALIDGQIRQNSQIFIAGFSLSAYDYVPLILQYTPLIEATESGYNIRDEYAKDYQGLLNFISLTPTPTPPRLMSKASRTPVLTTEEFHTVFLQKNFDWLNFCLVFLEANVARSLSVLPRDFKYKKAMNSTERMVDYARQTEAHLRGEVTELGLQRAMYERFYFGRGFDLDVDEAERKLVEKAPITRTDRVGYFMRRGALSDITSLSYIEQQPNKPFIDAYLNMYRVYAGSPPAIHYLVARMFELGVAKNTQGNFSGFKMGEGSLCLAPGRLDRTADKALVSLKGNVKEVVLGQPQYAKGRVIQSPRGEPAHVIDMGMGGHGTEIRTGMGKISIAGMQWPDTHALGPAVHSAGIVAPMTVLFSLITAQGFNQPVKRFLQHYERTLPSQAQFSKEVAQFASVWRDLHEKRAFLVLCETVAENFDQYLEYTDKVFDSETRGRLVGGWVDAQKHASAVEKYRDTVSAIPAFKPPSVEAYFERFVDLTPSELQKFWEAHMNL